MLSLLITEADKKKLPIELHQDNVLTFLNNYDQLQDREKRLIAEGYPEKHSTHGSKVYASLIKTLTARSASEEEETTEEFKKRKSLILESLLLQNKKDAKRPQSPKLFHIKIAKKDSGTQTDETVVRQRHTQTDALEMTDSKYTQTKVKSHWGANE